MPGHRWSRGEPSPRVGAPRASRAVVHARQVESPRTREHDAARSRLASSRATLAARVRRHRARRPAVGARPARLRAPPAGCGQSARGAAPRRPARARRCEPAAPAALRGQRRGITSTRLPVAGREVVGALSSVRAPRRRRAACQPATAGCPRRIRSRRARRAGTSRPARAAAAPRAPGCAPPWPGQP